LIQKLPVEQRRLKFVGPVLKEHGIKLSDAAIYQHIKKTEKAARNGSGAVNGNGHVSVDMIDRISAAERAIKACGGLDSLKETVLMIERVRKIQ
jgi:hypothetical protein